jgi:hypothetical protein
MSKLFVLSLLSLYTTVAPAFDGVTATLSLAGPDTLRIRYDLPDSCQALPFINNGIRDNVATALRAKWTASDACGTVDGRGVRRADASCKALQFTVPASTEKLDRVFQWAFPIGGGLYSHTSAFAVDPSCGPVSWRFSAAGGSVVFDGAPLADSAAPSGDAGYRAVIFLRAPLASGARSYVDPRMSNAAASFVSDSVTRSFALYGRRLPGIDATRGFVAITMSPDERSWGGDVAAQTTIRLMVPASLPAPMEKDVHGFVAHEIGHMFQPLDMHDAWNEDLTMLKEGGAEFLQWMAQSELAWLDSGELKLRLENAINKCVIAAQGSSWKGIRNRGWGRTPYDCGLAFHVLGLAGRSTSAPAWQLMRDYYAAGRKGASTDFSTALECGAKTGCSARWLNRIAGAEPVAAVLTAYAGTGGFLKLAQGMPPGVVEPVMRALIATLMAQDCGGQISLYQDPGMARVGAVGSCKSLRQGMDIVAAEGYPLFAGPAAVTAAYAACAAKGSVSLGLQGGDRVNLACDAAHIGGVPPLFEVDMAVLRARL